jgi:hypothetical protein
VLYPRLIEVRGRCPPEDCGGRFGYAELLDAITDPKHERHAELTEWIDGDFDPEANDAEALIAEVAALAKSWSRKSTRKRSKGVQPRSSPVRRMLTKRWASFTLFLEDGRVCFSNNAAESSGSSAAADSYL